MQAMPALFIKDFAPRHERLLALAAILLALAAIAWTLWRYLPGWSSPLPGDSVGAPGTATAQSRAPDRSLADYALFGAASNAAGGADIDVVIDAPDTDLDLTLRGTLATEQPDQALAIIGDSQGTERRYAVGDELPGGATLHRVYRDRVILRRAGEMETLRLRDPERITSAAPEGSRPRAATGRERQAGSAVPSALGTAVSELRSDPAEIMRNFTAVPVQEDGRLVGVRLRSTGDGALLSRIGLHSSDVVTSVNGIPVNDMSRTGELMTQLQSASSFQVTVLRNGREQQINVSLDQ